MHLGLNNEFFKKEKTGLYSAVSLCENSSKNDQFFERLAIGGLNSILKHCVLNHSFLSDNYNFGNDKS